MRNREFLSFHQRIRWVFFKTFSLRQEYNSFKIMSSRFNSVLQNFKSFRNYADISYVNASYHMHVFYSPAFSLPLGVSFLLSTLQTMAWERSATHCCTLFRNTEFVVTKNVCIMCVRMRVKRWYGSVFFFMVKFSPTLYNPIFDLISPTGEFFLFCSVM